MKHTIEKMTPADISEETVDTSNSSIMMIAIDVDIMFHNAADIAGTAYVSVTNVPDVLPNQAYINKAAEHLFVQELQKMNLLELYPLGKSDKDGSRSFFVNTQYMTMLKITDVRRLA